LFIVLFIASTTVHLNKEEEACIPFSNDLGRKH